MAHDQEFEGSNPSTVYCMDVSNLQGQSRVGNLLAFTLKKNWKKGSQMWHQKKCTKDL
jgi:excinuclease UvrABC nuclease subunit